MNSEDNILPLIVEPDVLADHLADPSLLIIDVPAKAESYSQGHVPGAVYLDYRRLLAGTAPVANDVPDEQALSSLFSELGLTRDTHVVAYDDEGGGWAGRLLWTLELLGHTRYSYLNGGIHAWRGEELPTSTEPSRPAQSDYRARIIHPEVLITREELLGRLDDHTLAIWDARGPEEYRGEKGNNRHLGHIPSAVNFEWTDAMDRNRHLRLRDYAELITELEAKAITPNREVVTHCQSHHRSGFTWLVGKALGFEKIRAYPGSWQEWGNRDDTPIER